MLKHVNTICDFRPLFLIIRGDNTNHFLRKSDLLTNELILGVAKSQTSQMCGNELNNLLSRSINIFKLLLREYCIPRNHNDHIKYF